MQDPKSMGLLTQVCKGLLNQSAIATTNTLGDRTKYIGMSDIGKAAECMRAAVGNKLHGLKKPAVQTLNDWFSNNRYADIKNALKRQLTLQRGHWFEEGVVKAFEANGTDLFTQLEIVTTINGVPYKAHLDMVLLKGGDQPIVRVLELKSCKKIPENLYTSYEMQLYGQLGFLFRCWNEPCFGVIQSDGKQLFKDLTFPQIAEKYFGIQMPEDVTKVDIEGWLLALSMDDAKAFGAYQANATMFDYVLSLGEQLWQGAQQVRAGSQSLDNLDIVPGFHPLCDFCDHQRSCPKYQGIDLNNSVYDDLLNELQERKEARKILDDEIDTREEQVKDFYSRINTPEAWLNTQNYRFKCTVINGRTCLDQDLLHSELSQLIGEGETNSLIARCLKSGSPYQRLYVSKI